MNVIPNRINSIIAHDLKDPMASISGISDILISNWADFNEEEKLEILLEIKETSDSAMRLLSDLLDWSKKTAAITEPDFRIFRAGRIIVPVIEASLLKLKRKNVEIINQVPDETSVFGDENMFSAVIRNLLANAIKSCLNGGEIVISQETSGVECRFCISDNGIGMTKSQIDQLFPGGKHSSDFTVAPGYSNGFGLILCRDFITMNHGHLWAESEEGKGTRVYFTFPTQQETNSK